MDPQPYTEHAELLLDLATPNPKIWTLNPESPIPLN